MYCGKYIISIYMGRSSSIKQHFMEDKFKFLQFVQYFSKCLFTFHYCSPPIGRYLNENKLNMWTVSDGVFPFISLSFSLSPLHQLLFPSLLHHYHSDFISVSVSLLNSRPSCAVTLGSLCHHHFQTDTCQRTLGSVHHRGRDRGAYQCNLAGVLADP